MQCSFSCLFSLPVNLNQNRGTVAIVNNRNFGLNQSKTLIVVTFQLDLFKYNNVLKISNPISMNKRDINLLLF